MVVLQVRAAWEERQPQVLGILNSLEVRGATAIRAALAALAALGRGVLLVLGLTGPIPPVVNLARAAEARPTGALLVLRQQEATTVVMGATAQGLVGRGALQEPLTAALAGPEPGEGAAMV